MDIIKKYCSIFNSEDEEIYKTDIDNAHAEQWLRAEIPVLECPDAAIEKAYYYRWWVYRKHIKSIPDGYVVTEFLPKVPWSGDYNTINAPAGHHLAEGRWLHNADKYLDGYIRFWLSGTQSAFNYSAWLIHAIEGLWQVTGNYKADGEFIKKICTYYETREKKHMTETGMLWSVDDRDAMEYSISGTRGMKAVKGLRPTLNSYMCADAAAIARFAKAAGETEIAEKYDQKAQKLKKLICENLWDGGFFKAIHPQNEDFSKAFETDLKSVPRELIGYIPWCFNIPEKGREAAFDLLESESGFKADFGLTTAEQSDSRFMFEVNHECLWNGYVWPFATSQTLVALSNVIKNYSDDEKYKNMFFDILRKYAETHTRKLPDGSSISWIDEVRHPYKDLWTSRDVLEKWGWREDKGGYERGKDYNHSTFCDNVISGLFGVEVKNGVLTAKPLVCDRWDYFRLADLTVCGSSYEIIYDKTGEKFGRGAGLKIYKNGQPQ